MKEYMSIPEAAVLWNTFSYVLRRKCEEQQIAGAVRFGKRWLIPASAECPPDMLPYVPAV